VTSTNSNQYSYSTSSHNNSNNYCINNNNSNYNSSNNINGSNPTSSNLTNKASKPGGPMTATASIKKSCVKEKMPPQTSGGTVSSTVVDKGSSENQSMSTHKKHKILKESSHLKAIFDKYSNISHKKSPDQSQIGTFK
jgi:hypothetical protein